MIDWSKVDWGDVAIHVIVAVLLVIMLKVTIFAAALLVAAIFWIREASQRTMYVSHIWEHWSPLGWGWGSQMELYAPTIVALAVAAIIQFW